jgi:hypothetical protein
MALSLPCTRVASYTTKVGIPHCKNDSTKFISADVANPETEILDSFRVEDFDIEYDSAIRFRFMGNGTTQREVQMEDLAYYVK